MVTVVVTAMLSLPLSAHAVSSEGFSDVSPSSVLFAPLSYLYEKGFIQGYADGTFQPDKTMNRAEALKMLYSATKEAIPPQGSAPGFPDVPKDAWYSHYVAYAQSKGVVKGYEDGTFRPGNTMNRAEALKILLAILGEKTDMVPPEALKNFSGETAPWYAAFVIRATDLALTDTLRPEQFPVSGSITRGELATMLYRLLYIRENKLSAYPLYDEGKISYYADSLAGNATSSGEAYTPDIFSAAHPDAAFGSLLQVIDAKSKKALLVRVNDRGPHTPGRIVDLSRIAFESFYPVSKGVFDGDAYEMPAALKTVPKQYLDLTKSTTLTPVRPMPNIMWQNEVYLFEVKGNGQGLPALLLTSPSGSTQTVLPTESQNGAVYALHFGESGSYALKSETGGAVSSQISVYPVFSGRSIAPPENLFAEFQLDPKATPVLQWSRPLPNTVLRLTFTQNDLTRTLYVNTGSATRLPLEKTLLAPIVPERTFTLRIDGAQTSTSFSHDMYTEWQSITALSSQGKVLDVSVITPETPIVETPTEITAQPVTPPEATVPAPVPTTAVSGAFTAEQVEVLRRVNEERAKKGALPLSLDETLSKMAQYKAEDMASRGYFAHINPDGEDVNDWKVNFGYLPMVAENIAYSTAGLTDNINNLIKSPGHYANMVDARFEVLGVGISVKDGKTFLTQQFSAKQLSKADLQTMQKEFVEDVAAAGIVATYDASLSAVAQEWAAAISKDQVMSFSLGGRDVGDVLRERIGNFSFSMSVYGDVSIRTLQANILAKLQSKAGIQKYGFGVAQDSQGMIRMTLVMEK